MRKLLHTASACLALLVVGLGTGHAATPGEAELKAAFIYNFVQFTSWPSGLLAGAETVNICVRPDAAVGLALAGIAGKPVQGVPLLVIALNEEHLGNCHAVFVETTDVDWLRKIAGKAPPLPILTLADGSEPGTAEAMISLSLVGRKVVFDVDSGLARRAGLSISSRVLKLARSVK